MLKLKKQKTHGTSLYIVATNKIIISDMKENYGRIQTIAHECIHSCQEKRMLLFNFIFSNINIIYFIVISLLTVLGILQNYMLQIAIFMLAFLIQFSTRGYLEVDAMTKSWFLAEKYIKNKKIITEVEEKELLNEYEKINKVGIPFILFNLLFNSFIKILLYSIICIFKYFTN